MILMNVKISIGDVDVERIAVSVSNRFVTFHTARGDEITMEKKTLERGLACLEASKQEHK